MDIGFILILAAKNKTETCKPDNIYKLKTNPRIFRPGKLIILVAIYNSTLNDYRFYFFKKALEGSERVSLFWLEIEICGLVNPVPLLLLFCFKELVIALEAVKIIN